MSHQLSELTVPLTRAMAGRVQSLVELVPSMKQIFGTLKYYNFFFFSDDFSADENMSSIIF